MSFSWAALRVTVGLGVSPTELTPEEFKAWRVKHFGDFIGRKGSISACGRYLEVTRFTVWAYERGKWRIPLRTPRKMAALERDPDELTILKALELLRKAKGSGR